MWHVRKEQGAAHGILQTCCSVLTTSLHSRQLFCLGMCVASKQNDTPPPHTHTRARVHACMHVVIHTSHVSTTHHLHHHHRCPPPLPTHTQTHTPRTEVEEAKDQSGISADLQVDLVPFDKLVKHIGRKVRGGMTQSLSKEHACSPCQTSHVSCQWACTTGIATLIQVIHAHAASLEGMCKLGDISVC